MFSSIACRSRSNFRCLFRLQHQTQNIVSDGIRGTYSITSELYQGENVDPTISAQHVFPFARKFSTVAEVVTTGNSTNSGEEYDENDDDVVPDDLVSAELIEIIMKNPKKKFRPSVVRKRIEKLRVYEGKEKSIRGSPWKLNLVCQFAAGQTVPDALTQLKFVNKAKAPLVAKVIQRTANLANIRDKLLPCQLEVAECFSTHGTPLKRIRYHSKGRFGRMLRRFSHMNVKIREIDFDLKIAQGRTRGEIQRWVMRKAEALREVAEAKRERSETEELEKQYAALEAKKKKEEKEEANK